jgi:hypothetical protein
MSSSDGIVHGRTKIVDHGPASQRFNIVIVGDGYTNAQLAQYALDVQNLVNTMRATPPYDELWCGVNVYRVDVSSTDSGADDPGTCGDGSAGSGATPSTYFDATFCGDGNARRLLTCDTNLVKQVALAQVPEYHFAMCVVNTTEYGGSGGDVATFSLASSASEIAIHEMGHTVYGFADEYEYYLGCGVDTDRDNHPASEPSEPNVTINTDPTTIKWAAQLTAPADGLPTTNNANCAVCDPQGNPKASTYVGAYEGAHYYHCDAYRPQFNCKMRALNQPFCAVCREIIRNTLAPYLPAESLTLTTPNINFHNIPEGLGGTGVTVYRAIVFEVVTCARRTFRFISGPTGGFGTPLGTSVSVTEADADPIAHARLWLSYTSTTAGATASGSVTVQCDETGQQWVIPITANTVARPKAAVTFVLDHSGSMGEDAGGGTTKVAKLREAANIFVGAMLDGDSLGVARFDDTAQIVMPVTNVGPPTIGAGRLTATSIINGPQLDPAGATSIGAGVQNGKSALDTAQAAASPPFDVLAMLVLTDGVENTAPMLADVSSSITANTFAVGLGLAENISVAALNALTQGHGGYLLVTGALTPDQAARLDKYFLQILAGITNADVVLDPGGVVTQGQIVRIPFYVSETDMGLDAFLLSPATNFLAFALEAPDGSLIYHGGSMPPNVHYVDGAQADYYRLGLPADPADSGGTHSGTWHILLALGGRRAGIAVTHVDSNFASAGTLAVPYDVVVHCYSNLNFRARAQQSGFEPGAKVRLMATLEEYETPVENRAHVWAEIVRPDASSFTLAMPEAEPGRFEAAFDANWSGLYRMRVRALGATYAGHPFQREQTLTAAVYAGGDRPSQPSDGALDDLCRWITCMLRNKAVDERLIKRLREQGFDLAVMIRCLEQVCKRADPRGAERIGSQPAASSIPELARQLLQLLDERAPPEPGR